jgi:hypothetical protein
LFRRKSELSNLYIFLSLTYMLSRKRIKAEEDVNYSGDDVFKFVLILFQFLPCVDWRIRAQKKHSSLKGRTAIKSTIKYDTDEAEVFSGLEDDSPDESKRAKKGCVPGFCFVTVLPLPLHF